MSLQEERLEGANNAKSYVTKACNLCGELALTNMTVETCTWAFSSKIPLVIRLCCAINLK